jgi:hypothetical protein
MEEEEYPYEIGRLAARSPTTRRLPKLVVAVDVEGAGRTNADKPRRRKKKQQVMIMMMLLLLSLPSFMTNIKPTIISIGRTTTRH